MVIGLPRHMKIYIVIPLYNEEKHIRKVLEGVQKYKLPVVVVDDGSSDSSKAKVLGSRKKNVILLEHKINLGKGAAMKTGAEYAFRHGAGAVIFMDSDNQHSPDDLPKFVEALKSAKYDVVYGSRNLNFGVPFARYLGNKFSSVLAGFLYKTYVSDLLCGFRAVTKKGYEKIKWESTGYGVETEMVARAAVARLKFCELPVETIYHSKVKGVTPLDGFAIFFNMLKWRLTI